MSSSENECALLFSNSSGNIASILELNRLKVRDYIPVLLYISIGIVIGTTGNAAVIYVYSRKMERTGTNRFVVMLGACDFLSCVFSMPMELLRVSQPHIFSGQAACKLSLLIASAIAIDSGLIIFAISIDRYRRMCRPFDKQLTQRMAEIVSVVLVIISFVLGWPSWLIYGTRRTPTQNNMSNGGCECGIAQSMFDTIYPRLFYYALLILSVALFSIIFLLYFLIAIKVWRHKNKRLAATKNVTNAIISATTSPIKGSSNSLPGRKVLPYLSPQESEISVDSRNVLSTNNQRTTKHVRIMPHSNRTQSKGTLLRVTRTSSIMALIAVTWVLSYMPHIILVMLEIHVKGFRKTLTPLQDIFFQLAIRSYLLNNAVNPIIYGVFNMRFRREVRRLFSYILPPCVRPNIAPTQPSSQMCSQPSMDD
ncbi:cholecystokinin receptor type A-like [Argonauta hians]